MVAVTLVNTPPPAFQMSANAFCVAASVLPTDVSQASACACASFRSVECRLLKAAVSFAFFDGASPSASVRPVPPRRRQPTRAAAEIQ